MTALTYCTTRRDSSTVTPYLNKSEGDCTVLLIEVSELSSGYSALAALPTVRQPSEGQLILPGSFNRD